jgi:GntR family transcriptional regulator
MPAKSKTTGKAATRKAAKTAAPNKAAGRKGRSGRRAPPLYHQLYFHLRRSIVEMLPEQKDADLPSEPALAAQFGVSRVTVRKTLQELEAEGLVRRVRGRGTFPNRSGPQPPRSNISSVVDNLLSVGTSTTAVNLSWDLADAAADIAEALGSSRVLRIVRVRSFGGQPMSLTTLYIPDRLAALLDATASANEPIIRILERNGVLASQADQTISAQSADATAARHLKVKAGAPLIAMRRLMFEADRRPILHQESLYPADRFEYRMILSRAMLGPTGRWTPIS